MEASALVGIETVYRQASSPTRFLKPVHRQNRRQFTETFEDNSPTKLYIVFIFVKLKKCPYIDHKMNNII